MKILATNNLANLPGARKSLIGGTANFSRLFYPQLVQRGLEIVNIVYEGKEKHQQVKAVCQKKRGGSWWIINLPRTYFAERLTRSQRYRSPRLAMADLISACQQVIEVEKPDAVFLNGIFGFPWALLVAAKTKKVPVVIRHAGIWYLEIGIYSDLISPAGAKMMRELERDGARLATRNVFLNETTAEIFAKKVAKIKPKQKRIIPSPCLNLWSSSSRNRERSANKIGVVARWDRIKNHEAVLALAKEARVRNLPWEFYAITVIPDAVKNQEFGVDYLRHIKVLPPRSSLGLRSFYQAMDLLILPSHFDVSPGVVIEAAMAGTATVISPNVGYARFFQKFGAGRWVNDFSDRVKTIKVVKSLIGKTYPDGFLNKLKQNHDPEKIANQYEALFKKIK